MTIAEQLAAVALERGLRQSTALSYERLLRRLGILDRDVAEVTREAALEALWTIENPNTRRATIIALRAVLGLQIKIPRAMPRRYTLPDETTLRLALMTSRHEARGLLMMYAGLRIGEACAVTRRDLDGDLLTVDKQVQQLHRTGRPTTVRLGPVKSGEGRIVVPLVVQQAAAGLEETVKPDAVRESLRRAGRRVGVALNPHLLRHWYATTLLARGANLALVSSQLRHSDVSVTLRTYAQFNARDIHDLFS